MLSYCNIKSNEFNLLKNILADHKIKLYYNIIINKNNNKIIYNNKEYCYYYFNRKYLKYGIFDSMVNSISYYKRKLKIDYIDVVLNNL